MVDDVEELMRLNVASTLPPPSSGGPGGSGGDIQRITLGPSWPLSIPHSPPLHHASSQSDNSKLRNPRAPRADFQRCFPDSDFFPDSGPPGLELPPWSHCANFPAADPVQKNLPMLPAWLQLELPVYFPRSQAAWARENGAKVAESRAQPRFDVRYGSRDRERGVKFRSSNSGGGGHSGLIH